MSLPDPAPDATVLVTGASSGIGRELARELGRRGYGLTLVARARERLEELADELRAQHNVTVAVHAADLGDDGERDAMVAAVRAQGRRVDALCNNAGFGTLCRLVDTQPGRETTQVRLNVLALHALTDAFVRPMVDRGQGAVLNLGSIAGFQPLPGFATYAASKAFVNAFSEALHAELHGTGVSCTLLAPGPVRTEFGQRAGAGDWERLSNLVIADPADVARAAVDAMRAGRRSLIPGLAPQLSALGGRVVPRRVLLPLIARATERVRG
ncbi:MAG TPA: SDR family oxidoreductase [Solirubrobacteraceae bacterium]|nr:SDR family oxidoreductase [Solirubrobacteraceae bacterium]